MAVAMEGFSIRGYASRMRSIDVVKCWPFDEANAEVVTASLPPITIEKFSWWFDKLQLVQDDKEISDLDSESLQSMRMKRSGKAKSMPKPKAKTKTKAKAPKKRSIVELFSVAPQVERMNSDDENENGGYSDDEEEESNDCSDEEDRIPNPKLSSFGKVGLKCKSTRKVKKKGILSVSKREKIVMIKDLKKDKVKKKQKAKKIAVDLKTKKKDKTSRLKLQTSVDIMTTSNCTTYTKDLFDAFSTHSKKPRLKRLTSKGTKCKISSTSTVFPHDQEAVFTVRGILKNQNKITTAENCSDSILQDASKLSCSNTQHFDKHVTFSGKDDVLEPRRNAWPSVELELHSNLFSDVNHATLANGHTEEMGKILSINEMNGIGKEGSKSIKDKFEVQQVTQKQFSGRHHVSDTPNFDLRQHGFSQANFFGTTVPFGQGPSQNESHNRVTVHDALYSCSSEVPTISQEPYFPKLMIPMFNHSSDAFNHGQRLLDLSGDAGPKHYSDCSMDFQKAYPQHPASFLSIVHNNSNSRPVFPSQNIRETDCENALSCQWIPHLSPKELMHTICSLPDWNSRASMYGGTSMNDNFVGLPLNSLGEFISVDSSVKEGFNDAMSISAVPSPSLGSVMHNNVLSNPMVNQLDVRSWNEMNSCNNEHKTCRINNYGNKIECCALPARIGMIEQYGNGRRNTVMQAFDPYSYPMESDMDKMKVSRIECRPHNRHEHPGGEMIRQHGDHDPIQLHVTRSTMRLMGKEFTIGGKDLEGCESREVWTDKQIIAEHCGGSGSGTKSSSIKCQDVPRFVVHPILGKLTETVADFSKAKINQASANVPQMMVSESKISSQFFDCHNAVINQTASTESKEILIPEIYPHLSLASSALPNSNKSVLQDSFSCSSPSESSRIPIPASTLLDSIWNVSRSRNIPEHKQNPLHGTQFALKFPFSDSECGRHIHPYWSQKAFNMVSPYLLDSREKGTLVDYRHPCSAPGSACCPCSISGTNYGTGASVFSGPEPFHFSVHSSSQNAFTSAPCSSFPGKKILFDNQSKPRFNVRIPNHGKLSKKRLPPASNGSKKSSKIPKIGVHDDCSKAVAQIETGSNFEGDIQCSNQALEPSSTQDNAGIVECSQSVVRKDNLEHCTAMDPFKLVGSPRSGPLKLTAGGRYILRPCQESDRASPEPTNSTIPVVSPTCDRRVLDSEKSSEVYTF